MRYVYWLEEYVRLHGFFIRTSSQKRAVNKKDVQPGERRLCYAALRGVLFLFTQRVTAANLLFLFLSLTDFDKSFTNLFSVFEQI